MDRLYTRTGKIATLWVVWNVPGRGLMQRYWLNLKYQHATTRRIQQSLLHLAIQSLQVKLHK